MSALAPLGARCALVLLPLLAATTNAQLPESVFLQERLGFGPTPVDTDYIESAPNGGALWIQGNLTASFTAPVPRLSALETLLRIQAPHGTEYPSSSPPTFDDVSQWQIARAIYARNQLSEQMTSFWNSHFNTNCAKTSTTEVLEDHGPHMAIGLTIRENEAYRSGGLGYFRDLLQTSAMSPLMLVYLDGYVSPKDVPNENYARELMELHTVGDGNYYWVDMKEAAKVFTGLDLARMAPEDFGDPLADRFDPDNDDAIRLRGDFTGAGGVPDGWCDGWDRDAMDDAIGDPTPPAAADLDNDGDVDEDDRAIVTANFLQRSYVMGPWFNEDDYTGGHKDFYLRTPTRFRIPAGTTREEKYDEITQLLDYLAGHEHTRRYVCAKLIAKFLAPVDPDDISAGGGWTSELLAVHADCVAGWQTSGGNIMVVLMLLFDSDEFKKRQYSKTETAFESAVSTVRALESTDLNVGLITKTENLEKMRASIEDGSRQPFFTFRTPDGFPENARPATGDFLARMDLHGEYFRNGILYVDWAERLDVIDPGAERFSPLLPAKILAALHGEGNYSDHDVKVLRDYQLDVLFPLKQMTYSLTKPVTFTTVCNKMAALAASFPQGFRQ